MQDSVNDSRAFERATFFDRARHVAGLLLKSQAIVLPEHPVRFTSRRLSPVYVDVRSLMSCPRSRMETTMHAAYMINREIGRDNIDIVAGGETAGIPFAAWLADDLHLPMAYVRKHAKDGGRGRRIEGRLQPGQRVLLMEDLISEGSSKANFIQAIRDAGGIIEHVVVVFDYAIFPSAHETLRAAGVTLHALTDWWTVLSEARKEGLLPHDDCDRIERYLRDPDRWLEQRDYMPVNS